MKRRIKVARYISLGSSFERVLKEERCGRKLVPDAVSFCDYPFRKKDILKAIITHLDTSEYIPQTLIKMDVPNNKCWIRPGSVPTFEDSVLYDAFAYYIGSKTDSKINSRVFSNRFNRQNALMPGIPQWKKFESAFWNVLKASSDEAYTILTDVTSFYTNISLKILYRIY